MRTNHEAHLCKEGKNVCGHYGPALSDHIVLTPRIGQAILRSSIAQDKHRYTHKQAKAVDMGHLLLRNTKHKGI